MPLKYSQLPHEEKVFVDISMMKISKAIERVEDLFMTSIEEPENLGDPVEGNENVVLVMPYVQTEFNLLKENPGLEFSEVMVAFNDWLTILELGIENNPKMLLRTKVYQHLFEVLMTCKLIEHVFESFKMR